MDNPETLAILGAHLTKDEEKQNTKAQHNKEN